VPAPVLRAPLPVLLSHPAKPSLHFRKSCRCVTNALHQSYTPTTRGGAFNDAIGIGHTRRSYRRLRLRLRLRLDARRNGFLSKSRWPTVAGLSTFIRMTVQHKVRHSLPQRVHNHRRSNVPCRAVPCRAVPCRFGSGRVTAWELKQANGMHHSNSSVLFLRHAVAAAVAPFAVGWPAMRDRANAVGRWAPRTVAAAQLR
jgi:hypothetical protein